METFLANAKRVLCQKGYFLYADFCNETDVALLHSQIEKPGMKILKREDITANVSGHWIWTINESCYLFKLCFGIGC